MSIPSQLPFCFDQPWQFDEQLNTCGHMQACETNLSTIRLLNVPYNSNSGGGRERMAFTTHEGLYKFKVIDDINIIGHDFDEHLHNVGVVLQKLRESGLRVKPNKCVLC